MCCNKIDIKLSIQLKSNIIIWKLYKFDIKLIND